MLKLSLIILALLAISVAQVIEWKYEDANLIWGPKPHVSLLSKCNAAFAIPEPLKLPQLRKQITLRPTLNQYACDHITMNRDKVFELLKMTSKAIHDTVAVYSLFKRYQVIDVYLFLIGIQPPDFQISYASTDSRRKTYSFLGSDPNYAPWWGAPDCRIKLFPKLWTDGLPVDKMNQLVAHEMYHCVQQSVIWEFSRPDSDPSGWWMDGSAVYMSSVAYKNARQEEIYLIYDPTTPIYHLKRGDGYPAYIFFQALENSGRTADQINDWVLLQTLSDTDDAERKRLSNLPGFVDHFEYFAKQFSIDGIVDQRKSIIPTKQKLAASDLTLPDLEKGGETLQKVSVVPFAMKLYRVQLPKGSTFQVSFSSKLRNLRINYHFDGETKWNSLPNDQGNGPDHPVVVNGALLDIDCSVESKTFFFLITSTDDVASAETELKFVKTDEKNCVCKRQDDDSCPSCLVGTWNVDKEAMKSAFTQALAHYITPEVEMHLTAIQASGTGSLTITAENSIDFVWDGFALKIDTESQVRAEPGEDPFPKVPVSVTIFMNGELLGDISPIGPGSLSLTVENGSGESKFSAPVVGDVITPIGKDVIPANSSVRYVCTDTALSFILVSPGAANATEMANLGFTLGYIRANTTV